MYNITILHIPKSVESCSFIHCNPQIFQPHCLHLLNNCVFSLAPCETTIRKRWQKFSATYTYFSATGFSFVQTTYRLALGLAGLLSYLISAFNLTFPSVLLGENPLRKIMWVAFLKNSCLLLFKELSLKNLHCSIIPNSLKVYKSFISKTPGEQVLYQWQSMCNSFSKGFYTWATL